MHATRERTRGGDRRSGAGRDPMTVPATAPQLHGQVALVTGAARGQGRSHCLALAAAGADVVALDICEDVEVPAYPLGRRDELDALMREVEGGDRRCLPVVADVRDQDAVHAAVTEIVEQFGRLDIVVNNAAIVTSAPFWELEPAEWEAVIDTNLTGVWRVSRETASLVRRSPRGRIVNIASTAASRAVAGFSHYVASKHGVIGLTRAMAIELAPAGVTVNAILPGAVDSPMLAGLAQELGLTTADVHQNFMHDQLFEVVLAVGEVTSALLWLLSDAATHVTGHCLAIDGGSLAH
jgi:NAD(P)-dependent dehydrogenase (short-subunit alcohol dehydrogenase family)